MKGMKAYRFTFTYDCLIQERSESRALKPAIDKFLADLEACGIDSFNVNFEEVKNGSKTR